MNIFDSDIKDTIESGVLYIDNNKIKVNIEIRDDEKVVGRYVYTFTSKDKYFADALTKDMREEIRQYDGSSGFNCNLRYSKSIGQLKKDHLCKVFYLIDRVAKVVMVELRVVDKEEVVEYDTCFPYVCNHE
jgi:hypothetical protein